MDMNTRLPVVDVPLDLTEFYLMRWRYILLLFFGRFLCDKLVPNKLPQGRLEQLLLYGQKSTSLDKFIYTPFFFCYLVFVCTSFVVPICRPENLVYYFIVAKIALGIRWEASIIWIYYFRVSPSHVYLPLLVALECCQIIGHSYLKTTKFIAMAFLGIHAVGNRYIVLECWLQGIYYPTFWFWPSTLLQCIWLDKLLLYIVDLHFPGLYNLFKYIVLVVGSLLTFNSTLIGTSTLLNLVSETNRQQNQFLRLFGNGQELHRMPHHMIRHDPLIQELAESFPLTPSSRYNLLHYRQNALPPLVDSEPSSINTYSSESSDEKETSTTMKRTLRPRKKFRNKQIKWELYEIPGYNEEDDSSYEESPEKYESSYEESSVSDSETMFF